MQSVPSFTLLRRLRFLVDRIEAFQLLQLTGEVGTVSLDVRVFRNVFNLFAEKADLSRSQNVRQSSKTMEQHGHELDDQN